MTKKERAAMADGLRKLSAAVAELAALFDTAEEKTEPVATVEAPTAEPEPEAPAKTWTCEEVRKILAEKARGGYRAEVKAILSAHGAKQLSDVTDPAELAVIVAEAEVIGSA